MSNYKGDIAAGSTIRFSFNTRDASGNPITLAGTPVVSIYKGGNSTPCATAPSLVVNYNSQTGRHVVTVDMSLDATFYATGNDFFAVITTGTVSGISVVGVEVAQWSVGNRSAAPTVSAIRAEMDANSTKLANLDATVSSRLASSAYTAPNNAGITAIKAITDQMRFTVANQVDVNVITGGTGGSGANSVTLTVTDISSTPIQGATVTAWSNGSIAGTGTTNSSGQIVLSLNNATYAINIACSGFNGLANQALTVNGATTHAYQLARTAITPSTGTGVTGYAYVTDGTGNVTQSGVTVEYYMVRLAPSDTGVITDPTILTAICDSTGLVNFPNLRNGATYNARTRRNGNTSWNQFVCQPSTFQITGFIG